MQKIASDELLEQAFTWLCDSRKNSHPNADVWHLRFHWRREKQQIKKRLLAGEYYFSPCRAVKIEQHSIGIWSAADSLVQKCMTLVLTDLLKPKLNINCTHLKGNGGHKKAVTQAAAISKKYTYVLKSDVKSYYATIDHRILLKQLGVWIKDRKVLQLLAQFLAHLDDVAAELFLVEKGITKGSSLSPLLGAVYLHPLDQALTTHANKHGLKYIRFMDDWLLMCFSRRQLRTGVRLMNQTLHRVKMKKAKNKTFIGRLSKGIDWLGYHLGGNIQQGVTIAKNTWRNHLDKLVRLYEQGASKEALNETVRRWRIWVRSGVELNKRWDFGLSYDEVGFSPFVNGETLYTL